MIILFPLFFSLSACSNRSSRPATVNETVSSSATHKASKRANEFKPNLKKKYPGSKLTSIPEQFRGTWYRSDPLSKSARKLIINKHTIGDSVVYRQVDKSIKLDHNSEQKNKTYSGGDSMIAIEQHQGQTWMRVREFLTTVDIIYITGQFKGHPCLYLAYSSGDIHNALFKNKALAIKYKNYDFSKIKS
ncbi:hypothetical protein [Lactobacillus crispatus]|nr:hypothetical protein [Lactobacillus crispatus]